MALQNKQASSQSGISKIKNFITNSIFHIEGFFGKKEQKSDLSIFGKPYSHEQGLEEFKKIIWITYRKNFPGLLKTSCYSDAGWGCMIRAGQMLLAQSLKRHLKIKDCEDLFPIISAFLDDDENKKDCINYSIQKVAKLCGKMFKLTPGDWLTVSNIAFVLEQLHNDAPLRGYDKLKFKVFNNSAIFYQTALKQLGQNKCSCKEVSLYCPFCHKQNSKFSLLLIVLTRLGAQKTLPRLQPMLLDIFKIPQFNGMIGGKPSKALFFVGADGEDLIYLDPHYVQSSSNRKNLPTQLQSYFCPSARTIQYSQIEPSIGLSFFIQSLQDLELFSFSMNQLQKKYGKQFIIYTSNEEQTPIIINQDSDQYVLNESPVQIIDKQNSSSFEQPSSFDIDI